MRKYREIIRIYLKAQLAWRADALFNMLFVLAKIMFAYLLWGIIYDNRSEVAGFTFQGMLSYYLLSAFLSQIEMSKCISEEMTARIRNGTFSKYMVVPVNVQGYFMAMEMGKILFYIGFDVIAVLIWKCLFRIQFTFTKSIMVALCAVIIILLGMIFMAQLNYYLGILTLKYQEIGTFLMIKNNLAALVTGSLVPLALFPDAVLKIMKFLPFYYVVYLPSMLLSGKCEGEAVSGIVTLIIWCVIMEAVLSITWKCYSKKYEGVGI
ncbi:MAG: ABC transporter permease [Lachnospiraceae bacterium]|nr:ABC transporter permease [Lachnospiraceae bacterium]